MCTAISLNLNDKQYFIRTLDLDYSFGEKLIITPREKPLPFRLRGEKSTKYAFWGVGDISDGFPLYAEGVNEAGLMVGGLHFPTMNGYKKSNRQGSLLPFEIIPYILGNFKKAREACNFLSHIDIVDIAFNDETHNTPLHFHIADKSDTFALEVIDKRVKIEENPFGVLTNSPPFSYHKYNMARYLNLSENSPKDKNGIEIYSNGLLATGLPGDFSSPSRFIRAGWLKSVLRCDCGMERYSAMQLAESISIPTGAVIGSDSKLHYTRYYAVYDISGCSVIIKRYDRLTPRIIDVKKESLEAGSLISYAI